MRAVREYESCSSGGARTRVKIKPRHTPSHWSASQQTFPGAWLWSLRLRIKQGSEGVCARCEDVERCKKPHDEQRGGRRNPGVRQPGAGRGQLPARSKSAPCTGLVSFLTLCRYVRGAIRCLFDSVRRFRATFLLHTTCMRVCCN